MVLPTPYQGSNILLGTLGYKVQKRECLVDLGLAPYFETRFNTFFPIRSLHIEGDNLLVVNAVLGKCAISRQIDHLIRDIRVLLRSFSSWTLQHIYREANQVADWVANVGHLVDSSFVIASCPNSALHSILVNDILGPPLVRRVS